MTPPPRSLPFANEKPRLSIFSRRSLFSTKPAKSKPSTPRQSRALAFERLAKRECLAVDIGAITGAVFIDLNGNGLDGGDTRLAGVDVRLFRDGGDGVFGGDDTLVATEVSAALESTNPGAFAFEDLSAGLYFIDQDDTDVPAGLVHPNAIPVTIANGSVAQQTIDSFDQTDLQTLSVNSASPLITSASAAPEALGGERDVTLQHTGPVGNLTLSVIASQQGNLALGSSAAQGFATLQYDGTDNSTSLNTVGLGGLDLQGSDPRAGLVLEIRTDLPAIGNEISVTVFSTATEFSIATIDYPAPDVVPSTVFIPFTSFTSGAAATGPADFANVGAIEMRFALASDQDVLVERIESVRREVQTINVGNSIDMSSVPNVDLSIAKQLETPAGQVISGSMSVRTGDTVVYRLTINNVPLQSNAVNDVATGVTVVDTLPAGVTFVSGAINGGTTGAGISFNPTTRNVTANVGTVNRGTPAVVLLTVSVDANASPFIVNTASVSNFPDTDNNSTNDTASVSTSIAPSDPLTASISGRVFIDLNNNGNVEANEVGIPGVTIRLRNSSGTVLRTANTESSGVYSFANLAAGVYEVEQIQPTGFLDGLEQAGVDATPIEIADGIFRSIIVAVGQSLNGFNYGEQELAAILSGQIYCDANNNQVVDDQEQSVGVRVFIDRDGDRLLGPDELSVVTDSQGIYRFNNLPTLNSLSTTANGQSLVEPSFNLVVQNPQGCVAIAPEIGVTRVDVVTGSLSRSLASADIDLDGDTDLLVVNELGNDVSVLLYDASTDTYAQGTPLRVGQRPQGIAVWQPDRTEVPVVAVAAVGTASDKGSLFIIRGSETKTLSAGNGPIAVLADDFDKDGSVDFVTASFRSGTIVGHFSQAADSMGQTREQVLTSVRSPRALASGFINDDAFLDIIAVGTGFQNDRTSEVVVLLGDGRGNFDMHRRAMDGRGLMDVAVGNFDSDAQDEIVVANYDGNITILDFLTNEILVKEQVTTETGVESIAVNDINRDGRSDLVVANVRAEKIDLFIKTSNGFERNNTITGVPSPSDIALADFNADGVSEIAVSNLYGGISPSFRLPSSATILRPVVAEREVTVISNEPTTASFRFNKLVTNSAQARESVSTSNQEPASLTATASPSIASSTDTSLSDVNPLDVDGSGQITPRDALLVINYLSRQAEEDADQASAAGSFDSLDVNQDGVITPMDALRVINYLDRARRGIVLTANGSVSTENATSNDERTDAPDTTATLF